MESLFFWVPVVVVLTFIGLGVYLWAVKSGQYDDLERDSQSIFFEEENPTQKKSLPDDDNHD